MTLSIWSELNDMQRDALLSRPAMADNMALRGAVSDIIQQVKDNGDDAVKALTAKFDGVVLNELKLSNDALSAASGELSSEVKAAIELAYSTIKTFHSAQMPQDIRIETAPGVTCELKHAPIDAVGLYIPGGSAPLPSTVLMLGVTAQVAGCRRRVLCTPPGPDGTIAAEIRYAARLCGIEEIYLCGGAQAIAALALGTQSIDKVDKIYGPGNSFVTEAKQQVSQLPGGPAIDMPAGPSEVLVIADQQANPEFIASDLLSQAEHGPDSQAVLVCHDRATIEKTQEAVSRQLARLSRKEIAAKAISHSRYILTSSLNQSVEVSNRYAPEHLIVQTDDARALLPTLTNAGSIFLGPWSPESAGDYASGTNHVLPTYGYARNYSSLGLMDFMRRFTVQELSQSGLKAIGPAIMTLADAEGLDAHREAVAIRLSALQGEQR
ncbi:histidinol dehydrogenase [Aestuariibacter salexigens]|uniref:histidinol dehydrogenase n=1 Tax=Aestuariibacter salexigens TaxID=226010 RepID=UPI0004291CFF|nr:histidinol dehydrogenase [Aestuariibacter salexigens]